MAICAHCGGYVDERSPDITTHWNEDGDLEDWCWTCACREGIPEVEGGREEG